MNYFSYSFYNLPSFLFTNFLRNNGNSLPGLCPTMRTNIILRSNSYYKLIISSPICRNGSSTMSMRRFCSRQCNTITLLCTTLFNTIRHYSYLKLSPIHFLTTPCRRPYILLALIEIMKSLISDKHSGLPSIDQRGSKR
jgi:hypothetical protein